MFQFFVLLIVINLSNRRRKRPRRYSEDFVDAAVYDVEANFDSDDDIVGEAVYDDEYLKTRKNKSASSGSEGDEEYKMDDDDDEDEENQDEDEYVEEEEDSSMGSSEEDLATNHRLRRHKKEPVRPKRGARKLRSVDEIETGLRRSKRSTRPRINYRKYELSESDTNSDADADEAYSENDQGLSTSSQDQNEEAGEEMEEGEDDYDNNDNDGSDHNNYNNNGGNEVINEEYTETVEKEEQKPESVDKETSPSEEKDSLPRRFLDLNDPAPGIGFDDGPDMSVKDEDMDDS